jgi:hypothetical protein
MVVQLEVGLSRDEVSQLQERCLKKWNTYALESVSVVDTAVSVSLAHVGNVVSLLVTSTTGDAAEAEETACLQGVVAHGFGR